MTSDLNTETIVEMTQEVWTALLADDGHLRPGGHGGGAMAASISISGVWNGTACLTCSEPAARHAAAVMFGMSQAEITDEEVHDAIGELINVVGGNIKGILPGPTELSLPTVHADEPFAVPTDLELGWEVNFTWLDEPVGVTVWTGQVDPAFA
ncbi:MAG TPA: chemotaxis protein CheX [Acidimicrobiales bacterium]|jgi:chemotaxis protein CheX|nr:chemotaxis protein CheX [Acidimicrobiales bacterium]